MDMYIYIKEEIKERQYRLFVKHTGAGLDGTVIYCNINITEVDGA